MALWALCIPAPQLSAVQFDVSVGCLGHIGIKGKDMQKSCHFKTWTAPKQALISAIQGLPRNRWKKTHRFPQRFPMINSLFHEFSRHTLVENGLNSCQLHKGHWMLSTKRFAEAKYKQTGTKASRLGRPCCPKSSLHPT